MAINSQVDLQVCIFKHMITTLHLQSLLIKRKAQHREKHSTEKSTARNVFAGYQPLEHHQKLQMVVYS